ncbi:hypothetical protein CLM84_28615, partial [Streptomyces albidoflavus]
MSDPAPAHGPAELPVLNPATGELLTTVEEYIDGIEFSVDGPVLDGRFHPPFEVEKTEHDDGRHHEPGPVISHPVSARVRSAVGAPPARVGSLGHYLGTRATAIPVVRPHAGR